MTGEPNIADAWAEYQHWSRHALQGDHQLAEQGLKQLLSTELDDRLRAQIHNDLGVLASIDGRVAEAIQAFELAKNLAPDWSVPFENHRQLEPIQSDAPLIPSPRPGGERVRVRGFSSSFNQSLQVVSNGRRTRVAILSLLFNWPSTGGGTVHTAETGKFLTQAGYETRHFYAQYPEWGLGNVTEPPLSPSEGLQFTPERWTVPEIQSRFRAALQSFVPDWVIITDSWNSKPILAEAARDYKFFLRIAAQECLCPLNNVRLLYDEGHFHSCPKHQLATPADCCACVYKNGKFSGGLHQAERELVGYGTNEYDSTLRWAFANAEAVLVVNPLIGAMISPYAKRVCVIPSGFDAARFPKPLIVPARGQTPLPSLELGSDPLCLSSENESHPFSSSAPPVASVSNLRSPMSNAASAAPLLAENGDPPLQPVPIREAGEPLRILFAGLVDEPMKGFQVIHEACRRLWNLRQDFELLATADPPGKVNEFTSYIGWQSQAALPSAMSDADIVVVPTIAEEALGRTAVEAMGAGRPVVASRIGGLQFTVVDGATGLLFDPGNIDDLCRKLSRLLDDSELRERLGRMGRERFEEYYSWESILAHHYLPLLGLPA